MGLRFHKSLKLLPGVRLNLAKTGISLSLGQKGMSYNIGGKGSKTTLGLPGTGLSYSAYTSHKDMNGAPAKAARGLIWLAVFIGGIILLGIFAGR